MTSRDEAIDWVGLFVDVLDLGHPFVEPWNELEAKISEVKEDLSGVLLDSSKPLPRSVTSNEYVHICLIKGTVAPIESMVVKEF